MSNMDIEYQTTRAVDTNLDYDDLKSRDTRCVLFQLLYAYHAHDYCGSLEQFVVDFNNAFNTSIPFVSKTVRLIAELVAHEIELDAIIEPLLTRWKFNRISVCTKLILRLAIWELSVGDVDDALLINESIELAKGFGEHDSFKFVNGILDRYVKQQKEKKEALPCPESVNLPVIAEVSSEPPQQACATDYASRSVV